MISGHPKPPIRALRSREGGQIGAIALKVSIYVDEQDTLTIPKEMNYRTPFPGLCHRLYMASAYVRRFSAANPRARVSQVLLVASSIPNLLLDRESPCFFCEKSGIRWFQMALHPYPRRRATRVKTSRTRAKAISGST